MGYIGNDGDHAQQAADDHVSNLIDIARSRLPTSSTSNSECDDCGKPIPKARQLAMKGCTRCIACQNIHDASFKINIRMLDRVL